MPFLPKHLDQFNSLRNLATLV